VTAPNRYALLGRLATGGMAELFLARSEADDAVVVLKRIKPARHDDPKYVQMFLDEAKLVAQLRHDNIARVFDIGRLGESYFFTMEYIHGEDLRAVMSKLSHVQRRLPIEHALQIAAAVAAGLHHAHERTDRAGQPLGIVHRDVSPANVMVGFDGSIKVIDFGIAKATTVQTKTKTGAVKGKVTYFSPEQCRGTRQLDRRSDVYSIGIVLHELLTGRRLFRRATSYETMQAILTDRVPLPSSIRSEVSTAIDIIVLRALARQPAERFPSAGEMADAITAVAAREGLAASPGALGQYLRELFGDPAAPAFGGPGDQASPVTVTSIMHELESGAGERAGLAFADTVIEADLEHVPDTIVQPARDTTADDEWRDEVVIRGQPRDDAPALDPAAVIAEVNASAGARAEQEPTIVARPLDLDFLHDPHEARTVAAVPKPSLTDPRLDVGDHRSSIVDPAVRRAYLIKVAVAAGLVVAIAVIVIARAC
jgi:tRNA A-37 threonylcarbamoyl transferase component Bud32